MKTKAKINFTEKNIKHINRQKIFVRDFQKINPKQTGVKVQYLFCFIDSENVV